MNRRFCFCKLRAGFSLDVGLLHGESGSWGCMGGMPGSFQLELGAGMSPRCHQCGLTPVISGWSLRNVLCASPGVDPDPALAHPRIPPTGELRSWEQN